MLARPRQMSAVTGAVHKRSSRPDHWRKRSAAVRWLPFAALKVLPCGSYIRPKNEIHRAPTVPRVSFVFGRDSKFWVAATFTFSVLVPPELMKREPCRRQ